MRRTNLTPSEEQATENGGALGGIAKLVRQYVIRDLTPPALPPVAAVPPELQRHYTGYYQGISPRMQMLYGLERLINIKRLVLTTNGLSTTVYGLNHAELVPVTDRLFRQKDQSVATLALLSDADGEVLTQSGWGTYKKVSGVRFWGQLVAISMIMVLMVSSPLFALVWGSRRLLGRLDTAGPLSVRIVPLLSTIVLGAFWGVFLLAMRRGNLFALGVRSWLTVSIMLLSIVFAFTAAGSLYVVYRARSMPMNHIAYWHSALVAASVATVVVYMGYWGLIGLCLWG